MLWFALGCPRDKAHSQRSPSAHVASFSDGKCQLVVCGKLPAFDGFIVRAKIGVLSGNKLCVCVWNQEIQSCMSESSQIERGALSFFLQSLLCGAVHICDTTLYVALTLQKHKLHFTCVHILYFTSAAYVALPRNIAEWCNVGE